MLIDHVWLCKYTGHMDERDRKLALMLSQTYDQQLGPLYQQVRAELLGKLTHAGAEFEDRRQENFQRRTNLRLLNQSRTLFPQAQEEKGEEQALTFEVDDLYIARMLQLFLLWNDEEGNGSPRASARSYKPYYIVGERPGRRPEKCVELLGLSALPSEQDPGLCYLPVKRRDYERFQEACRSRLASEFSPAELDSLYDPCSGLLKLTVLSIGMTSTRQPIPSFPPVLPKQGVLRLHHASSATESMARLTNISPSNVELAQFSMIEHLGQLATAFGVAQRYQALLVSMK
jgi:hypothetical protein